MLEIVMAVFAFEEMYNLDKAHVQMQSLMSSPELDSLSFISKTFVCSSTELKDICST